MLLDISPLCLYHNCRMILIEQTLERRRLLKETYHWFACPVQGYNQHYDMKHGYHVMRNGAFEDSTNEQLCANCSHFPYLAKRGATMADTVWFCANEQGPYNKS